MVVCTCGYLRYLLSLSRRWAWTPRAKHFFFAYSVWQAPRKKSKVSKSKCLFTGKFDIGVSYPDIIRQKSRLGTCYAPLFTGGRKKLEFTPLSPPAATFDALVLMNQGRGTVETLQRIPPGLPNDKPRPEMAHSGCRHHCLQLYRRRIVIVHTLNSLIISNNNILKFKQCRLVAQSVGCSWYALAPGVGHHGSRGMSAATMAGVYCFGIFCYLYTAAKITWFWARN